MEKFAVVRIHPHGSIEQDLDGDYWVPHYRLQSPLYVTEKGARNSAKRFTEKYRNKYIPVKVIFLDPVEQ